MDFARQDTIQLIKKHYFQCQRIEKQQKTKNEYALIQIREIAKKVNCIHQKMKLSLQTFMTAVQILQRKQIVQLIRTQLTLESNTKDQNQKRLSENAPINKAINTKSEKQFQNQFNFKDNALFSLVENKQKYRWKLAITILFIAHKVVEDMSNKFSINVWLQVLDRPYQYQQIFDLQAKILKKIDYCVLISGQSVFEFIQFTLSFLKIQTKKQFMLCQYIIQLSVSHKLSDLVSLNLKKIVLIVMSAVRLSCHFLRQSHWNPAILHQFQISQKQIDKKCSKLFKLMLQKDKNKQIHIKYQHKKYLQISKIRLVKVRQLKDNQGYINSGQTQQFPLNQKYQKTKQIQNFFQQRQFIFQQKQPNSQNKHQQNKLQESRCLIQQNKFAIRQKHGKNQQRLQSIQQSGEGSQQQQQNTSWNKQQLEIMYEKLRNNSIQAN